MATGTLRRWQDPEYTGANRCLPCTIVNSVIAVVLAGGIGAAGVVWATPTIAGTAAGLAVLVSAASIYFKGYLVPGTPALTKRYFPPWLLDAFGKGPEPAMGGRESATNRDRHQTPEASHEEPPEEIDLEEVLVGAGALEPCQGGADLCLTDAFRQSWHEQMAAVDDDAVGRDRLPAILDIAAEDVTVEDHGEAFRARVDDQYVGTWESRAAFVADIAAADVLSEWLDDWDETHVTHRGQLLNGLRLFLTTCPACEGDLAFGTDTVESCCTTREVAAVSCERCETRLFESDAVA